MPKERLLAIATAQDRYVALPRLTTACVPLSAHHALTIASRPVHVALMIIGVSCIAGSRAVFTFAISHTLPKAGSGRECTV
jgi:hypothetical protein